MTASHPSALPARLAEAAERLAHAWRTGEPVDAAHLDIRDDAEAGRVQMALWQGLEPERTTPGGWKVGAAGPTAPVGVAPLPASGLLADGATVAGPSLRLRGVEIELALRVARTPQPGAFRDDRVPLDWFDAAASALELVETRIADSDCATPEVRRADLQSHHRLVLGHWQPLHGPLPDLRTLAAGLRVDCGPWAWAVGAHPAGDLPRLLRNLAGETARRGHPLQAGQVVTTGACTGLHRMPAGARVDGRVGDLPPVSVRF